MRIALGEGEPVEQQHEGVPRVLAAVELERPRIPAASASRRLLLRVQPVQLLQRALDLRDLLLDGVRSITVRVFFWTSVVATVSSKGCSVGLRSKVGERSVGGRSLACGADVAHMLLWR